MKKLFLVCIAILCFGEMNAQFNYGYKSDNVPVVGVQYGIVGGGHSAGLYNRDDMESPFITPQIMNFTYFAGVERVRWYTPYFGVGQQFLLWNAGAKYTGITDTSIANPSTIDATTLLTYAKMPVLFWFKSYNRYHPDRKIRINTFFGPYIALLTDGQEQFRISVPDTEPVDYVDYTLSNSGYVGVDTGGNEIFSSGLSGGDVNNALDWGFTMGGGAEMRIWRKTVISLMLRADLGMSDVENKGVRVVDGNTNTEFGFYEEVTAKYVPLGSTIDQSFEQNRPTTRNYSFGVQLSIRKYFGVD